MGDNVRLVANLYDLDTGTEVAQGTAEGPGEDVLTLADDLAVETRSGDQDLPQVLEAKEAFARLTQ